MRRAFCVGTNPDIFYEDGNEGSAKAHCQRCPVVVHCLEWALSRNEEGIWGGTNDAERRALKRGGPRASCPGCASNALYSDGLSEICVSCGLSWLT